MHKLRHLFGGQLSRHVPTNTIAHLRFRRNGRFLRKSVGVRNVQSAPFSDKMLRDIQNFITEQAIQSSYRLSAEDSQIIYGNPKISVLLQKNISYENIVRFSADGSNNHNDPGGRNSSNDGFNDNPFSNKNPDDFTSKSYSQIIEDYSQEIANKKAIAEQNRMSKKTGFFSRTSVDSKIKRNSKTMLSPRGSSSNSKNSKFDDGKSENRNEKSPTPLDHVEQRAEWLEKIMEAHRSKRKDPPSHALKNVSREVAKTLTAFKKKPSKNVVNILKDETIQNKTSSISVDIKTTPRDKNSIQSNEKAKEYSITVNAKSADKKSENDSPSVDAAKRKIDTTESNPVSIILNDYTTGKDAGKKHPEKLGIISSQNKLEIQIPIANEPSTKKSVLNVQISTTLDEDEKKKQMVIVANVEPKKENAVQESTKTKSISEGDAVAPSLAPSVNTGNVKQIPDKLKKLRALESRSPQADKLKNSLQTKNGTIPWWASVKGEDHGLHGNPIIPNQNKFTGTQTSKIKDTSIQKNIPHKGKVSKSSAQESLLSQAKKVLRSGKLPEYEEANISSKKTKGSLENSRMFKARVRRRRKMNAISKVIMNELEKQNERMVAEGKRKTRVMSTKTTDGKSGKGQDSIGPKHLNDLLGEKKPKKVKPTNLLDTVRKMQDTNKLNASVKDPKKPPENKKDEQKKVKNIKDTKKRSIIQSKDALSKKGKDSSTKLSVKPSDDKKKKGVNISKTYVPFAKEPIKEEDRKLTLKKSDPIILKPKATKLSSKLNVTKQEQVAKHTKVVTSPDPQIKAQPSSLSKIDKDSSKSRLIRNKLRELAEFKHSGNDNEKIDYSELIGNDKLLRTNITTPKKGNFIDYSIQGSPVSDKSVAGQGSYGNPENASAEQKDVSPSVNEKLRPFIIKTKKGDLIDYGLKQKNNQKLADYSLKYPNHVITPMDEKKVAKESLEIEKKKASNEHSKLVINTSNLKRPKIDQGSLATKSMPSKKVTKMSSADNKPPENSKPEVPIEKQTVSTTTDNTNPKVIKTESSAAKGIGQKQITSIKHSVKNRDTTVKIKTSTQNLNSNKSDIKIGKKSTPNVKTPETYFKYGVKIKIEPSDPKSPKKVKELSSKSLDKAPIIVDRVRKVDKTSSEHKDKKIDTSTKTLKPINIRALIDEALKEHHQSRDSKILGDAVVTEKPSKRYVTVKKSKDGSSAIKLPAVQSKSKSLIKKSVIRKDGVDKSSVTSLPRPIKTVNPIVDKKLTPKELKNKIDGTVSKSPKIVTVLGKDQNAKKGNISNEKLIDKSDQSDRRNVRRSIQSPNENMAKKTKVKNTKSDDVMQRSTALKSKTDSESPQRQSNSFANNELSIKKITLAKDHRFENAMKPSDNITPSKVNVSQVSKKIPAEIIRSRDEISTPSDKKAIRKEERTAHSAKTSGLKPLRSSSASSTPRSTGNNKENILIKQISDDTATTIRKLIEARKAALQKKEAWKNEIKESMKSNVGNKSITQLDTSLKEMAKRDKKKIEDNVNSSKVVHESKLSASTASINPDAKDLNFSKKQPRLTPASVEDMKSKFKTSNKMKSISDTPLKDKAKDITTDFLAKTLDSANINFESQRSAKTAEEDEEEEEDEHHNDQPKQISVEGHAFKSKNVKDESVKESSDIEDITLVKKTAKMWKRGPQDTEEMEDIFAKKISPVSESETDKTEEQEQGEFSLLYFKGRKKYPENLTHSSSIKASTKKLGRSSVSMPTRKGKDLEDMFMRIESQIDIDDEDVLDDELDTYLKKGKADDSAKSADTSLNKKSHVDSGEEHSEAKPMSLSPETEEPIDMFMPINTKSTLQPESLKAKAENRAELSHDLESDDEEDELFVSHKEEGGKSGGSGNTGSFPKSGNFNEHSTTKSPHKESKPLEDTLTALISEKPREKFLTREELNRFSVAHMPKRSSKFYQESVYVPKKHSHITEHYDSSERNLMYSVWSNRFDSRYVSKHTERMDRCK